MVKNSVDLFLRLKLRIKSQRLTQKTSIAAQARKKQPLQLVQDGYMQFIYDLLIVTEAIFLEESSYCARQGENLTQTQQLVRQAALSVENGTDLP